MIHALIFDFDGTLVDSDPIKRSAFYNVTAGVPGAAEFLDTIFAAADSGDRYDIFETLVARLKLDSASDWAKAYGELCQRQILDLLARSNVGQMLARLKADGYRLFIASATPQDDLISLVEKSPLTALFSGVYGRPTAKTDVLRNILRSHNWTPHEIVMIGNSEPDREAAEEVGCPFVGIVGDGKDDFRCRPKISLHRLDELPGIVEHLNAAMPERAYP